MPKIIGFTFGLVCLCIGLIVGIVFSFNRDESENVEIARLERETRLLQNLGEARASVAVLNMLARKDYKGIEEWQLYLLDRHYDNLITEQSIRDQTGYESSSEWQGMDDHSRKLLDIKEFLKLAEKYENKLPSRNIPKKPKYPIGDAIADILNKGKTTSGAFKEHQQIYLYRKWIDYKEFKTYISYESEELDPSPGPEIILFFYRDRLFSVLHKEPVPYKLFVRDVTMSDYKVSYLFRLDTELEKDFDSHYGSIIANAD